MKLQCLQEAHKETTFLFTMLYDQLASVSKHLREHGIDEAAMDQLDMIRIKLINQYRTECDAFYTKMIIEESK